METNKKPISLCIEHKEVDTSKWEQGKEYNFDVNGKKFKASFDNNDVITLNSENSNQKIGDIESSGGINIISVNQNLNSNQVIKNIKSSKSVNLTQIWK